MKTIFVILICLLFSNISTAQYGRKLSIGIRHGYGIGILRLSNPDNNYSAKNQYFNTAIDFQCVLDKSKRLCLNIDLATTIKGFRNPNFVPNSFGESNHHFLYLLSMGGIGRYRITYGKIMPYVLGGSQINFTPVPLSFDGSTVYENVNKIDPNLILGGGVEFNFMSNIILFDIRYTRGIFPLYKSSNQSVSLDYISPNITLLERF